MTARPELAALILRISLGVIMLAHSVYLKMMVFTLPGTAQYFDSIGLPGFMAYVVFTIEVVAGIALILGVYSSYAAVALLPVMLGATWAHSANGWVFSNANGGWEFPLFLVVAAIVQVFLGDGAYALKNMIGQKRTQAAAI